ncbi:MAG: hypothetical protein SH821_17600 [Phototrophicales bacterium]|nr:hypothetical protein [Phototrophicales bacterium]
MVTDFEWDILQTVAYADIFDYPMTIAEIHRYLIGTTATPQAVAEGVGRLIGRYVADCEGYICLVGREGIIKIRQHRAKIAQNLWNHALQYGRVVGNLPFVKMVAVTGSLAVDNTDKEGDIDLMIITTPKRLWLCRLLVIGIVKRGIKRDGITLCPNYFVTTNAMNITDKNPFTARELAQMVPLVGFDVYEHFRTLNNWSHEYFPNAHTPPERSMTDDVMSFRKRLSEVLLKTPIGGVLEKWEMTRKIRKLSAQSGGNSESQFTADMCKGHFDGHRGRILSAYDQRLQMLQGQMAGD